jgi:hypothetical protein
MNYNCEICNYECKYESHWIQHINSIKHNNNGKTKKKINRNKKCEKCDYIAQNYSAIRNHYLSKHSTLEERKKEYPYYCEYCDTGTFTKCVYIDHNKSKKHIQCSKINLESIKPP